MFCENCSDSVASLYLCVPDTGQRYVVCPSCYLTLVTGFLNQLSIPVVDWSPTQLEELFWNQLLPDEGKKLVVDMPLTDLLKARRKSERYARSKKSKATVFELATQFLTNGGEVLACAEKKLHKKNVKKVSKKVREERKVKS